MREKERIERILSLIKEVWSRDGWIDQRFGQMLINLGIVPDSLGTWNMEDDKLEEGLADYVKDMKKNKEKDNAKNKEKT
jgi:hypothetical protein